MALSPNAGNRWCEICGDQRPHAEFASLGCADRDRDGRHSTCGLPCAFCVRKHFKAQIRDLSKSENITCPLCDGPVPEPVVRRHATEEDVRLLDMLQVNKAGLPLVWCTAGKCPSAQMIYGGDVSTCHACGFKTCATCNIPMHFGKSCDSMAKDVEESSSQQLIDRFAKHCPKCSIPIEKDGGCDHMTCRICRHEFCWACLAPYGGETGIRATSNARHERYCEHYRA